MKQSITHKNLRQTKRTTHIDLLPTKVRFGFTLAEVLITLGIIGVVAAMTIPNLIATHKAKRFRTQFLKSYSTIQQVFKQMQADDISIDPADYPIQEYYKVFGKYLKGATDCGGQEYYSNNDYKGEPCFNHRKKYYKNLQGKNATKLNPIVNDGEWLLPDGSLLLFENGGARWGSKVYVTVDLNGFGNPPDRMGYDVFMFQLIDENLKTMGDTGTHYNNMDIYCNLKSNNIQNGIACAQKAKENPDYFKWVAKNLK